MSLYAIISTPALPYLEYLNNGIENYETSLAKSTFQGKLAKELNLTDTQINEETLQYISTLISNIKAHFPTPNTLHRNKITGYDIVFTAPKSLSSLYLLDSKLYLDIHNNCVNKSMSALENLTYTLQDNIKESNPGICFVPFTHLINRAHQIDLHTHILLFNLQKDKTGNYTFYNINFPVNKLQYCKSIYLNNIAAFLQSKRIKFDLIKEDNTLKNIEISSLKAFDNNTNYIQQSFHKDNFHSTCKIINPYINNTFLYQTYHKANDVKMLHNIARKEKYNLLNTPISSFDFINSFSNKYRSNLKKVHDKIITRTSINDNHYSKGHALFLYQQCKEYLIKEKGCFSNLYTLHMYILNNAPTLKDFNTFKDLLKVNNDLYIPQDATEFNVIAPKVVVKAIKDITSSLEEYTKKSNNSLKVQLPLQIINEKEHNNILTSQLTNKKSLMLTNNLSSLNCLSSTNCLTIDKITNIEVLNSYSNFIFLADAFDNLKTYQIISKLLKDKDKNLTFCNINTQNSLAYQNICSLLKLLTRNKPYSLSKNLVFPFNEISFQSYLRKDTNCIQVMAQQLGTFAMNDNIKNSNLTTKIKTNNQTLKEKLKFNYLSLSNQLDI